MNPKSLIKQIFLRLGIDIRRVAPKVEQADLDLESDVIATVGRFPLTIPRSNPVSTWYSKNPAYLGQLQRLVEFFHGRFPDLVAVDVGANIGDSLALIKSGGEVAVVCIEGDPEVFRYLSKNAVQFPKVRLVNSYLAGEDRQAAVAVSKAGWNSTLGIANADGGQSVCFRSLDAVLLESGVFPTHAVLKVDVEGYEPEVIKGAMRFLVESRPVILVEYNQEALNETKQNGREMLEKLAQCGYGPVMVYEAEGAYLTAGDIGDPLFRTEISRYCRCPYRLPLYLDLLVFPGHLMEEFRDFRKMESARP